jgi:hypothetical protein
MLMLLTGAVAVACTVWFGDGAREHVIFVSDLLVHRVTVNAVFNFLSATLDVPLDEVALDTICALPTQRSLSVEIVRADYAAIGEECHRDPIRTPLARDQLSLPRPNQAVRVMVGAATKRQKRNESHDGGKGLQRKSGVSAVPGCGGVAKVRVGWLGMAGTPLLN